MGRDTQLLEREAELARINELVDAAAAERGGVTVVEGEAGIGKSTLLGAAREYAVDRGFRVRSARGGELEREFPFGVVRQLFEASVREADGSWSLEGAARLAAPALGLEEGRAAPDAAFTAQHGLYWLTESAASVQPLLLCVDDAQWADRPSLDFLLYLARRLDGVRVSVLVGWRIGEPESPAAWLELLRAEPSVVSLAPSPLSEQATAALVRRVLGESADQRYCRACHQTTGGNPFLLSELAHAVAEGQLPATPEAAVRVRELGPAAVSRSVLLRLSRLEPSATALAQAVAVLDTDARLDLAAGVAELPEATARRAAEELQGARILAHGLPLRFAHPILRAAIYAELSEMRRSSLHRRAADMLQGDPSTIDRAATHLVATAPSGDPSVVERLRTAAERALQRGSAATAIRLCERAMSEPPQPAARGPLLLTLGHAEFAAGEPTSTDHLRDAFELCTDSDEQETAARALSRASIAHGDISSALTTLEQFRETLTTADDERALRAEVDLLVAAVVAPGAGTDLAERIEDLRRKPMRDPFLEHAVLAIASVDAVYRSRGTADTARNLAWEALAGDHLFARMGTDWFPATYSLGVLMSCDADASFLPLLDRAVAKAREADNALAIAMSLGNRGRTRWLWGDLPRAEADAREAVHLMALAGQSTGVAWALSILLAVLADRGELDAADALLAAHDLGSRFPPRTSQGWHFLAARSRLRLMQRRLDDACRDAQELIDQCESAGYPVPAYWAARLVPGLAALTRGDRVAAHDLVAAELANARAWRLRSAIGIALRAQGLVDGGNAGIQSLRESVAELECTPRELELARSLVELGAALRRAGQRAAARDPLRHGMELARRCGAPAIVEQAMAELRATGARPRSVVRSGVDALTASQLRVAELAASGMSNREIAQTLYITRKTVEGHLGHAYDKLGVRSRHELAGALAPPVEPAPIPDLPQRLAEPVDEGVVATVLFTDIVGSTQRARELGERRWCELHDRHDALVRDQLAQHAGREIKTLGDGFLATFESATRAVRCALAITHATTSVGLQVRCGLHTGELEYMDGDVRGTTVNVAARLVDLAFPGEVVCSHTVHDLATGQHFAARGDATLKGLPGNWRLYTASP